MVFKPVLILVAMLCMEVPEVISTNLIWKEDALIALLSKPEVISMGSNSSLQKETLLCGMVEQEVTHMKSIWEHTELMMTTDAASLVSKDILAVLSIISVSISSALPVSMIDHPSLYE